MKNFKKRLVDRQIELINQKEIFEGAHGDGIYNKNPYKYILENGKEWNNLYSCIRDKVKAYFTNNKITFWGGKTITPNTLSSQVSCLNHLFLIRDDKETVKSVIQVLVGDKIKIKTMEKVISEKERYDSQYIAFEMISEVDRLNEDKRLTRGKTCTSIDAFAIAKTIDGKRIIIVMEWKLVEDDSGNKAPDSSTSNNDKAIISGNKRVQKYGRLINGCNAINDTYKNIDYHNSSLFHLPFYELMRQTLWANINKVDFKADDYLHINVIPQNNPMRLKNFKCVSSGIVDGWRKHLSDYGNLRYIDADPYLVVKALKDIPLTQYSDLIDYLERRYYTL